MSDIYFLYPGWLWLIPLSIAYTLLLSWIEKQGLTITGTSSREAGVSIPAVRHPLAMSLPLKSSLNNNPDKSVISVFLTQKLSVIIISTLMLVALAQPVQPGERVKPVATSADVMLIIDTSISMVMRDYILDSQRVDRMTMMQALLDRFSRRFTGERIGIIIFGDQALMVLQPSKDKALVRHMIHRLKPTIAGRRAAIGDAIAIAADYIQTKQIRDETVLVLISSAAIPDGKLSPVAGVEHAMNNGTGQKDITLHTIAIGSPDVQASLPGELIYEPVDIDLLQQLAEMTGGESFHAKDVTSMDAALHAIEKRHQKVTGEKNMHDDTVDKNQRPRQPLYYWPLLGALLFLMLFMVRPHFHFDRNRNSHYLP